MKRPTPPSGANPPEAVELPDGSRLDLGPPAEQLCRLYYDVYPDDLERYGAPGQAWCDHDSRYLLAWALEDARAGTVDCVAQVTWLARVLKARAFPIERFVRHVELTADVLTNPSFGDIGAPASERMREAAHLLTADQVSHVD